MSQTANQPNRQSGFRYGTVLVIALSAVIGVGIGLAVAGRNAPTPLQPTPSGIPTPGLVASTPQPAAPEVKAESISPSSPVQRIGVKEAKELVDRGAALLYDVRPSQSYDSQHLTGAISLPESQLDADFDTLPTDKALVFYCA